MKKAALITLILIVLSCFYGDCIAELADSAWPMFQRDLNHTGCSPYNGPATSNLKWSYTIVGSIRSSATFGEDGTIYVCSTDGYIYALNPNGTFKWSYGYLIQGGLTTLSPAVGSDGTIYAGIDGFGRLFVMNSNGTVKWTYNTGGNSDSSPAIGTDDNIYIGSPYLYALDDGGSLLWSFDTGAGGDVNSSPAIGSDGTIYVGSRNNKLYAINSSGTMIWSYTTGDDIYSSPAIGSDGTVYVGSHDDKLYAIDSTAGTLDWSYTTGGDIHSSPAIGPDGTVYVGSDDYKLYAIRSDGVLRWTYSTGDKIFSSPAIGANGIIYVGSINKKLFAINSSGIKIWSYLTGGAIYSSPTIGSDGTLYVGTDDNKLYAFKDLITPTATPTATPTSTLTSSATQTATMTPTLTATLTQTATLTATATATKTLTPTQTATNTATPSNTSSATSTPSSTKTQTKTPTQTPTQTSTVTRSPTKTATKTITQIPTQTLTGTVTNTATKTITRTPTLTATPTATDDKPILFDGKVEPAAGTSSTTFEYLVSYIDDSGVPSVKRVYINGTSYSMSLKSGQAWDGIYHYEVIGLPSSGSNEYYFLFVDPDGNLTRLPTSGSFSGPVVNNDATKTPTITPTKTNTSTPTQSPSGTITPTTTPAPTSCLRIACPTDFYYNTVLLSWTPIYEAAYYKFECAIAGNAYSFDAYDNQIRLIAKNAAEWQSFIDVGAVYYRVSACDGLGKTIEGPTNITLFRCKPGYTRSTEDIDTKNRMLQGDNTECLRIANPHEFYFNTIILSWTPIYEADHYLMEYQYNNMIYTAELKDNYLRLLIPDMNLWTMLKMVGQIPFRIKAVDVDGKTIEDPQTGLYFRVCK